MKYKLKEKERYESKSASRLKDVNSKYLVSFGSKAENIITSSPYLFYEKKLSQHITKNDKVLELCCGDGNYSVYISFLCEKLYSSDISSNSIKLGKLRAKRMKRKNINFKVMNAEKIDFQDNFFDVVTMAGSLSYLEFNKLINEVRRVLKIDGKFIIVDSLNHNIFYKINRFMHFLKGDRTLHVVNNIPNMNTIKKIQNKFNILSINFFGIFIFFTPILKIFFSEKKIKKIMDILDSKFKFFKKFSFKFVLCLVNNKI